MNADDVHAAEQRWHLLSLREQDEWGHHTDPRRAFIAATLTAGPGSDRVGTAARDEAIQIIGGAIVPGTWPVEAMAAAATDALVARPDVLLALLSDRQSGPRDTREALTVRLDQLRAERDTRRGEQVETAAQVLHDRRHRAGTAHTCDRCREDAAALAAVLTASSDTGETP